MIKPLNVEGHALPPIRLAKLWFDRHSDGHPWSSWCIRWCSLPYGFLKGKDFRTPAFGTDASPVTYKQGVSSSSLLAPTLRRS